MRLVPALAAALALPLGALAQSAADSADDDTSAALVSKMVTEAKVTEMSGLVVVARPKAVPLSGVEVVDRPRCLPPRDPVDNGAPAPRLVSAYPADGQTVAPGYAVLRLTFDLPMACRADVGTDLRRACTFEETETWHVSYDRRSLLILCKLKPKSRYRLNVNPPRLLAPGAERFQGLSGREAGAGQITFDTSQAPPVMTVADLVGRDPPLAGLIKR